ncbi:hypothetical protein EZS27_044442, partial [termite gut metagenome]
MKKSAIALLLLFAINLTANAQKFAVIDMEYILKHIPAYEKANEQLDQISQKYQNEIAALTGQAQSLYKEYQSKAASLAAKQRTQKEEEIVAKEKAVAELRRGKIGLSIELAYQRYVLKEWGRYFPISDGNCNNISLQFVLGRSSIDNPIF